MNGADAIPYTKLHRILTTCERQERAYSRTPCPTPLPIFPRTRVYALDGVPVRTPNTGTDRGHKVLLFPLMTNALARVRNICELWMLSRKGGLSFNIY